MNYTTVKLQQQLEALEKLVGTDKSPANDQKALDLMKEGVSQAKKNSDLHAKIIAGRRKDCKERITRMITLLKQKNLEPKDYKEIKLTAPTVIKYIKEVTDERGDYTKAMADGFRGGWPQVAKNILTNPAQIKPFEAVRKSMIDNDNKVSALGARLKEYEPRVKEILKQAVQREKQGAVDVAEFDKDIESHKTNMEGHTQYIDGLIYKNKNAMTRLEALKKVKTLEPKDKKLRESDLAIALRSAKEARGRLKTMMIEHKGLEKRAKAAGPGWKERALRAVKESKAAVTSGQKLSDAFTKRVQATEKILNKL